jgi:hypothetical protein
MDIGDAGWFWPAVRTVTPSGLPRLVYSTGYGGFSDSVNLYPAPLPSLILNLNMRRKYIDSRIVEGERWGINCGYAHMGQVLLMEKIIIEKFVILEVLVAVHGINNTRLSDILNGTDKARVVNIDLSDEYKPNMQHQALMLGDSPSKKYVVPALLRVLDEIDLADREFK